MPDPISITAIATILAANTPIWFSTLQSTVLNSGGDIALQKGFSVVRGRLHLDEKEQLRHLKAALQHAVEAGQNRFQTPAEQAQYRAILAQLSTPGIQNDTLRKEVLRLFTVSETPHLAKLNELYNRSLCTSTSQPLTPPVKVDAAPYLVAFFSELIEALYADAIFKPQISDVLHLRITQNMQHLLADVSRTLHQMQGTLSDHYTMEQFERDKVTYIEHLQRTLRTLKLVGVVPKGRGGERPDPELGSIFVPLRLKAEDTKMRDDALSSIIGWLQQYPYLVLLGGPGSGKSTAVRYLAWSHAVAQLQPPLISSASLPLLPDQPFPLRIELRRLSEERHQQQPNLDFLDYTVRVVLGRAGQHIKRRMLVELLIQGRMLCLFDGLDEVATLDERRLLIDEIEAFVQHYPNNRVLVTSRPVGYDLARLNAQMFMHTNVQDFDDQQIGTFLDHWYTHVLQLSPLPPEDSQELETLYTTLKDNPRLHTLATNPLLLTVITALHRYERLPDRRILVYDRCADLLLDTWAKLKGTDVRWKEMKMGKEDQKACVAHLGFVLHERSQEKRVGNKDSESASSTTDIASDVPTRFILKEIEKFLKERRLLSEVAEQRAEARRFLELMQIEAGLIVERGKGEHGEDLYGFVHRTFQEYFAAADVYESYQQEEDATIISDFLHEHLYDPHWHETILLLMAMLKRRPATTQLRQILKHKSRLGLHNDILHQDLFFVCTCLAEDIAVDIELAESVVANINIIVKQSPFPSQRKKALDALASLLRTRQYAHLGREALRIFATQDVLSDPPTKVHAVELFCKSYPEKSPEQQMATRLLMEIMQRPDISIDQSLQAAEALYGSSSYGLYERRQATKKLAEVAQRSDLSIDQSIQAARKLYYQSPLRSPEEQIAIQKLIVIFQRKDLTIDQTIDIATVLSGIGTDTSVKQPIIAQKLTEILQRDDLTVDLTIRATDALLDFNATTSSESHFAIKKLLDMLKSATLTVHQTVDTICALHNHVEASEQQYTIQQYTIQRLLDIIQSPDLTIEQTIYTIQELTWINLHHKPSNWQQIILQKLTTLLQCKEITIEQIAQTTSILYKNSSIASQEEILAIQTLMQLLQRKNLTIEQTIAVTETFNEIGSYNPQVQEGEIIVKTLIELLQHKNLTIKQIIIGAEALYQSSSYQTQEQVEAVQSLVDFIKLPNVAFDVIIQMAQEIHRASLHQGYWKSQQHYQIIDKITKEMRQGHISEIQSIDALIALYINTKSIEQKKIFQMIMEMLEDSHVSLENKLKVFQGYYNGRSFSFRDVFQINEKLLKFLLTPELNSEQSAAISKLFIRNQSLFKAFEKKIPLLKKLEDLIQQTNVSIEQQLRIADILYICSSPDSLKQKRAITKLVELVERTDLSIEQSISAAQTLYQRLPANSIERQQATTKLATLVERTDLSIEQSISAAQTLYQDCPNKSPEKQLATQKIVTLVKHPDLPDEQRILANQALYRCSGFGSSERLHATQELQQQVLNQDRLLDQRIQSALVPITEQDTNYADRAQVINIIFTLSDIETATSQIKKQWTSVDKDNIVPTIDIPHLIDLVNDERIPIEIRDEMYGELERLIPEFGNIALEDQ